MDQEAVRLVAEMKSGWLRLGSLIQTMIDTRAYQALDFSSMHVWMEARLGESMASAHSALRSFRALKGISEEKLCKIGERNAHALTYLPDKERRSEEWLEKASKLPTKEFKQEVQIAVQKKTGMVEESFKTFSVALPEQVYESLCEAERKLARVLCIDFEKYPGKRIFLWEAVAQWILLLDDETIKVQTEGI
jgi:hypothetical protein